MVYQVLTDEGVVLVQAESMDVGRADINFYADDRKKEPVYWFNRDAVIGISMAREAVAIEPYSPGDTSKPVSSNAGSAKPANPPNTPAGPPSGPPSGPPAA